VAVFDVADAAHAACENLLSESREPRIVPAPVLAEVDYFLRGYSGSFRRVLDQIRRRALIVEDLTAADYERADEWLGTYADLEVGFVDSAVLAITERLGETKLATLDHRHFAVMRPRHCQALELLPG
jgi:predicted nucleic acid-binding protein